MTRHVNRLVPAVLAVAALGAAGATSVRLHAAPSSPEQSIPVFGAETSQVLVDVVVRDRKGRLVRDLSASDFEVYEDRARQAISNFRVVALATPQAEATPSQPSASAAPPAASPAAAPSAPAPRATGGAAQTGPAVIAFLFDGLSPAARDTAHRAALAYSDKGHVSGDLVGVFAIDVAMLHVLQPFTGDMAAVRAAFDRAARQGPAQEDVDLRAKTRGLDNDTQGVETRIADLTTASAAGAAGANTSQAVASLAIQRDFDMMQSNMLNAFDRLGRDQQGFASTNGLMSVVNGLKALPGRKTIVFFSEGLQLSSNVLAEFRSVVAAANRANVTVYAIDAGGLRVDSTTREARAEVVAMAQRRLHQEDMGGVGSTERPMTEGLERAEDALRQNPHAGLGQLAEETGGFLVANTNDASQGFERIQEEMRFYYLLSYSPTNAAFDGSYRSISVKVNRPGVSVYTRKGYLAVRPDTAVPVRSYEAPVMAVLERVPRPKELPLHATAMSFPEGKRLGRVPVMVELPASALSFVLDEKKKVYKADFSIVARLRDWQGREVDRLGRHYPLTVPAAQIEATKRGDVLFFQETDLPPGRYTLEAAAYDSLAQKASVATARVEVGAATEGGPRLSSLVLLSKVEKLTVAEQARDNPLHYGETIVYPNMGRPYSKAAVPAVGFFFTVYTDGDEAPPTQANIEILKDGRPTARTGTALGAPDKSGRIQQAGALPLERLVPGDYTLKLSVPNGAEMVSRQADFVVEP